MANDNKVHFGLKRAMIWPLTETTNPQTGEVTTSYGAGIPWPGAVSLDLGNNASQEDFYADDGVYYVTSSASNYEGDYESASVPREFKKAIYGDIEDANGALIETKNAVTKYFAFGYETSGDVGGQRTIFYKCSATRPSASGATLEDGTEVQTESVTIKAIARADSVEIGGEERNLIQATLVKGQTGYETFFAAPYVPAGVPVVPSVTLQGSAQVTEGEQIQLVAQTVPAGAEVTWASSAEGKATVDEYGVVSGVEAGSANITATITVDGVTYSDTCVVTVNAAE
jgi:phi13 family phage major tail protein